MERIISFTVSDEEPGDVEAVLKKCLKLSKNQISQAKFRAEGICKNNVQCRIHEKVFPGDIVCVKSYVMSRYTVYSECSFIRGVHIRFVCIWHPSDIRFLVTGFMELL